MSLTKETDRTSFNIRPARKEDFEAMSRLFTLSNRELPILLGIGFYAIDKLLNKFGGMENRLRDPKSKMLIAETSQGIIGYLNGYIHPDRNTGWVQFLYVASENRRGIVAKRLLSGFEEFLMTQGIKDMEARVLKNGRPHRLAKLTGWMEVQEISDYEVHIWKTLR